jgi:hypothetical protein
MQSVPITTNVVSLNPTQAIQHYVIKFVSDLRQVGGFLQVLLFPLKNLETTVHILSNIVLINNIYAFPHSKTIWLLLYPRSTGEGYTVLPLSVLPSVQDIFRHIFLSNY